MSRPVRVGLIAAVLSLFVPSTALAAELTVDPGGTYKTISAAVAAAGAGDTITVLKGEYVENVTIPAAKKGLLIAATQGTIPTGAKLTGTITVDGDAHIVSLPVQAPANASAIVVNGSATLSGLYLTASGGSKAGTPLVSVAGEARLFDVVAFSDLGPAAVFSGPAENDLIVRSVLVSTEEGSDSVRVLSEGKDARKLTADSSVFVGGAKGAGLVAKSSSGSAGDITLTLRHVTIAGAAKGLVLDATAAQALLGMKAVGNITATVTASIVHGESSAAAFKPLLPPITGTANNVSLTYARSDAPEATATGGATVDMGGASFTEDSKLFAPDSLNLRQDAPVIDRGGDLVTGESETDVNGKPRKVGDATDIGADEFLNRPPKASFSVTQSSPVQGEDIGFLSTSTDPEEKAGGGIVSYHWDFGDGTPVQSTDSPATTHRYAEMGTYTVKLAVVDRGGLTDVVSGTIKVRDGVPPVATITTPRHGGTLTLNRTTKRRKGKKVVKTVKSLPLTLIGRESDASGVRSVEVALTRTAKVVTKKGKKRTQKGCAQYTGKGFAGRACAKLVWIKATMSGDSWQLRTRKGLKLVPGTYQARVRATDLEGLTSNRPFKATNKNLVSFKVR